MTECEQHGSVMRAIGSAEGLVGELRGQTNKIFRMLEQIKEEVDKNAVKAKMRDESLDQINKCVDKIDIKIENGIKSDIQELSNKIKALFALIEKKELVEEIKEKEGMSGFLKEGFEQFKKHFSFIFVTSVIMFFIYLIVWIFFKINLFGELPPFLR